MVRVAYGADRMCICVAVRFVFVEFASSGPRRVYVLLGGLGVRVWEGRVVRVAHGTDGLQVGFCRHALSDSCVVRRWCGVARLCASSWHVRSVCSRLLWPPKWQAAKGVAADNIWDSVSIEQR